MMLRHDPRIMRLMQAAKNDMVAMRSVRHRLKLNTYGQQWSDLTPSADGRLTSEFDRAVKSGLRPRTNNLLRSLVKTVVGRFRLNLTTEEQPSDKRFAEFATENQLDELDSRALEEFLISGCVIQKLVCERRPGSPLSVWADNISPDKFFANRFYDPRGADIRLIGHSFACSLAELKLRFGHGSRKRCAAIARCYNHSFEGEDVDDTTLCDVTEVWNFEIDTKDPYVEPHWHGRFMAPNGSVLDETRSPLPSGSHPYALKFYPLTDGEIHSFVEDLVGQQQHINSLITLSDRILSNSAKGVLLMPMDAVMPGTDFQDVCNIWSQPGGVIPINPAARMMPVEVSTSSGASNDAARLLDTELKLFQQISGVSAVLQGQLNSSVMSASLYDSQVVNSTIALLDVYGAFNSFRTARNRIAMELINIISR